MVASVLDIDRFLEDRDYLSLSDPQVDALFASGRLPDPHDFELDHGDDFSDEDVTQTPFVRRLCAATDFGDPQKTEKWCRWVCEAFLLFDYACVWDNASLEDVLPLARAVMARSDFRVADLLDHERRAEQWHGALEPGERQPRTWIHFSFTIIGRFAMAIMNERPPGESGVLPAHEEFMLSVLNYAGYSLGDPISPELLLKYSRGEGTILLPPELPLSSLVDCDSPHERIAEWNRPLIVAGKFGHNGDFLFVLGAYQGRKNPVCDRLLALSVEQFGPFDTATDPPRPSRGRHIEDRLRDEGAAKKRQRSGLGPREGCRRQFSSCSSTEA